MDGFKVEFFQELDKINYYGSKLFVCPFLGRTKQRLACYYFVYFLITFTSLQLFITLCLTGFHDLMEIINIAPNIGASLMALFKYSKIHINRKKYSKIIDHFHNDLWDLIPDNKQNNVEMFNKYKSYLKLINKFIVIFVFVLGIVVDSFPWILMTCENKIMGKKMQYLYPFDAWYPFDKVKWYAICYIWESMMTAIVISVYGVSNMLNITIVALICMELNLLGNWLQDFINTESIYNINKKKSLSETHNNIKSNLKFVISRHGYLANISTELDYILGDVMLLCYSFGSLLICLTAYSFTIVDELYASIRYFSFFLSLLIEMFNQCIIGQILIDHSLALANQVYSSNWTYADKETKKMLLMLMMRTQKPFCLTAKRFITMDLSTFCSICSSSYQLFNLLRNVITHP